MDRCTDWIQPDLLVRIYILVCIVILVTITISPFYHPTTLALMFILFFLGYYSIIIPKTNQIKQRRLQKVEKAKRVQKALVLKEEGIDHYFNGQYHDAIEILDKSVYFNGDDAESLKYLGLSYRTLHQNENALNYLKRARNINPSDVEVNERIAKIESHLGFKGSISKFYNKKGEGKSALARNTWRFPGEAKLEKMMRTFDRIAEAEQERKSRAAEAHNLRRLGKVHVDLQRYDEALKYYKRSLYIERDIQNREGEALSRLQIAILYRLLQRYVEALENFVLNLAIERELRNCEDEAKTLYQIGLTYQEMCRYAEALEYYDQLLTIQQKLDDHVGMVETLHQIGLVYQKTYRYSEALNYFNQSLVIAREIGFKKLEIQSLEQIEVIKAKKNSELS